MHKRHPEWRWSWLGSLSVGLVIGLALATGCRPREVISGPPLRLGVAEQTPSGLALLARDLGAFEAERLPVVVTNYVSGLRALGALEAGQVDAATVGDVPIAIASTGVPAFRVVATLGRTGREHAVVARADRGIAKPLDLNGRVIATQAGSATHYYLHLFLLKHGLHETDVTLTFSRAEDLVPMLVTGAVDAVSVREPMLSEAVRRLGAQAIVFASPGAYLRSDNLVVRQEILRSRPEAVDALLRALIRVEEVFQREPARAHAMLAAQLKMEEETLAPSLRGVDFHVSLDQSLILVLEDEIRWARHNGLIPAASMPNVLLQLDSGPLERVRPESVTLIR